MNAVNADFRRVCQEGNLEEAQNLIMKGANDWNGAVRAACREGQKNVVEWLIEKGANRAAQE